MDKPCSWTYPSGVVSRFGLAASLALAGCNGPSGPDIPDIGGVYQSTTFWTIRIGPDQVVCNGSMNVNQSGTRMSGTFVMGQPCDTTSGSITNGRVDVGGVISFGLSVPGQDPNLLQATTGCSASGGDFTGQVVGTALSATAQGLLDCGRGGRFPVTIRAVGSRR